MILLEIKGTQKPYSIKFHSNNTVELCVSVYERMESKQFYADLESLVHKYIGERITKSTIKEISDKISKLEKTTEKNYG